MLLLQRQIPFRQAMGMMLTGQRVKAQRAYDIGLINEVVPRAELDGAVEPLGAANPGLRAAVAQGLEAGGAADRHAVAGPGPRNAPAGPGRGACSPRTRTKACWLSSRNANPSGRAASAAHHTTRRLLPWHMSLPRPASTSRMAPASSAVPWIASTRASAPCTFTPMNASTAAFACPRAPRRRSTRIFGCRPNWPISRRSIASSSASRSVHWARRAEPKGGACLATTRALRRRRRGGQAAG